MEASLSPTPEISLSRELLAPDRPWRRARDFADTTASIALVDDGATDESAVPDIEPRLRSELATRVVNCAIASLMLIASAPLLIVAAIAIKCTSPGPVFYMQTRVGLDRRRRAGSQTNDRRDYDRRGHNLGGRVFKIYKLRTMRSDAERRRHWPPRPRPARTPERLWILSPMIS